MENSPVADFTDDNFEEELAEACSENFDNLIFAVNKPKSQIEVFNSELKHLKTIHR
mgnify:CR=1 FL=1